LIKWWEGGHELYDLRTDLSEENNLADENRETVKMLDEWLINELEKTGAKFPKPNPDYKG
jgi:hypothetical protein